MDPVVVSPDNMDDPTFARHMTHRHGESLGGLGELQFRRNDGMAVIWRSFHRRLHEVRVSLDVPHEHAAYEPPENEDEPLPASRIKAAS
jgi:hypothetical protein